LISAISSFRFFAGTEGWTMITCGEADTIEIGAKFFTGS
jgi:hypothetical protein